MLVNRVVLGSGQEGRPRQEWREQNDLSCCERMWNSDGVTRRSVWPKGGQAVGREGGQMLKMELGLCPGSKGGLGWRSDVNGMEPPLVELGPILPLHTHPLHHTHTDPHISPGRKEPKFV